MKNFIKSSLTRLFWSMRFRGTEPATWLHEDLVRRRVNRRITGSENVWPLDWFMSWLDEHRGGRRFRSGVSLGCGEGALERAAVKMALCRSMVGLDLSGEALRSAAEKATEAGLDSIEYRWADMDRLVLEEDDDFEIALFHQSIHHVEGLESCLELISQRLPSDGLLYLDEYVGPSRDQWSHDLLTEAQAAFDGLPGSVKRRSRIGLPVDWRDPSEAVRSAEILGVVDQYFEIVEQRDYGGNILAVTCPWLDISQVDAATREKVLTDLLDAEEKLLAAGSPTYYSIVVASPRKT